jgi:4-carboxymuconolactone decarboxylase
LSTNDRYLQGWKQLVNITGEQGTERLSELQTFAPELCQFIVEFAYGDIYSRPNLSLQQRMIVTITSLLTQGDQNQLKVHIQSALRVGLTSDELMEIMLHCIPYIGFPKVMDGISLLKQVVTVDDHHLLREDV